MKFKSHMNKKFSVHAGMCSEATYQGTSCLLLFIILTAAGRSSTKRESPTLYIKAGRRLYFKNWKINIAC
jgi:hypothetical protein